MLIGITGPAGSGKSTMALVFSNAKVLSFAEPIREMLEVCGFEVRDESQKMVMDPVHGVTPRFAMQTLGTEWGRKLISDRIWLDIFQRNCAKHENVVCPDVRFENEADLIRTMGGIIIHMQGRAYPSPKLPFQWRRPSTWLRKKHPSECGIVVKPEDLVVDNSQDNIGILLQVANSVRRSVTCA